MKQLLYVAGFLLLLTWGGFMAYRSVRGLRNNNPGNIKKSADNWQGLSQQQNDPIFFQFDSPEYGIRALLKILTNYERLYNLNTVNEIIDRWAPPTENDTGAYVKFVAAQLGVGSNQVINVSSNRIALAKAIVRFELGMQPYTDAVYKLAERIM